MELHDLRHCKVKAGGKLADAQELSRGILFSTYDLLIAGKTRGPKPKTAAASGSAAMDGTSPAAPADVDLGRLEFGDFPHLLHGLLHPSIVDLVSCIPTLLYWKVLVWQHSQQRTDGCVLTACQA